MSALLPFLKIGFIIENFNRLGKVPVSNERLIRYVSIGKIRLILFSRFLCKSHRILLSWYYSEA